MAGLSIKVLFIFLVILIVGIEVSLQHPYLPPMPYGMQLGPDVHMQMLEDQSNFRLELKVDKLIEDDEANFEAIDKYLTSLNGGIETVMKLVEHLLG
uniref:DUF148 domain-containing protein n=1 Tax=Strongyloides papillosus TaxID=174720 RepID=A0A0N5C184_STREA